MRQRSASQPPVDAARRRAAVRTAWAFGAIAVAVYAGFILMGVLAQ